MAGAKPDCHWSNPLVIAPSETYSYTSSSSSSLSWCIIISVTKSSFNESTFTIWMKRKRSNSSPAALPFRRLRLISQLRNSHRGCGGGKGVWRRRGTGGIFWKILNNDIRTTEYFLKTPFRKAIKNCEKYLGLVISLNLGGLLNDLRCFSFVTKFLAKKQWLPLPCDFCFCS